jgi:CheY-like chemotaxis protein/signal transduction histidine kinase
VSPQVQLSLRSKLVAIAASTVFAFLVVIVASSLMAGRVRAHLDAIQARHIPKLELGPQLEADFDALRRGFQDSVASRDGEALERTREVRDRLLARIDGGQDLLGAGVAASLRTALIDYYDAALDVSRRMIGKESGESIVDAMGVMQRKQASAQAAVDRASSPDTRELAETFAAAREAQTIGGQIRLGVTLASLCIVLALIFWISRGIVRSLGALQSGLERYGRGAFEQPIATGSRDELEDLADGANRMAARLAGLAAEREQAQWVSAGLVELSGALGGELEESELATRAVRQLAQYVGAPASAIYRLDTERTLRLLGHCALSDDVAADAAQGFRLGEGLVGRAAMSPDILVVDEVPSDFMRVRSGLGGGAPRAVVFVPLVREGQVFGVVELACFKAWSASANELLLKAREGIALALEVARRRADLRGLLARTQEQAARLSAQDEELRATNEELHMQQEELRQTNEELAQQTEELEVQRASLEERNTTLQATRAHLEKQAHELTTVSAYKSQFLANMSHELRTPLNSMLLLSNLLGENQEKNLTDKQVEYAKTIYSAGRDLLGLINQVLDLAKVEAGKQEVRVDQVKLRDVADRARRVFAPLAKDRGLALSVKIAEDVPESLATDDRLLMQILNNLLGNAIKFTDHGEVTLRIGAPEAGTRLGRSLRPAQAIEFAVSDTGLGIAAADQERVFAPFEQVDATVGRRHGGTGLGLNIAREHARLLGGELRLQSVLGKGSTFALLLPTQASTPSEAPPPLPAQPPVAVPREERRPSSLPADAALLVIEDDPTFAEVVGQVVHERGLGLVLAADGAAGLRIARDRQPSGIILDVKLPDIDGWQVMEQLRADPRTANIPVHFVSALDMTDRAMALGATGYLTKPATRQDLARVVESLAPRAGRASCRILVVEDDVALGESVLQQLTAEKLEARRVTTAREALAVAEQERFACIILDLSLPDMGGLELLEQLQARMAAEMPAVVIYTARALSKAETTKLEAYAEAVVLKDGSSAERLLDEIRLFVRRLEQGIRPRRPAAPLPSPNLLPGRNKILVVDDDMRTVYALSAALRAKGAQVLVAENGAVALAILADHADVAAVLMDVMMPEMDGYEATRRIRQDARFKDLPIVALTAKAMKGDEERCLEAGATDYLPKPVDANRLLALLHTRLSNGAS